MRGFESALVPTADATINVARGGSGPPLLLLHGFPQTLVMWRDIAPLLAAQVSGGPVDGGQFFPEQHPAQTAAALAEFFNRPTPTGPELTLR
jgi:haloacetate dehalogenase